MGHPRRSPQKTEPTMNEDTNKQEEEKLPSYAHIIAGWPLIMIVIGGAIGGLCGGGAYGASIALLKKKGISFGTCLLSFVIGVVGIGFYFVVVVALAIAFPDIFGNQQ